MSLNKTQLGTFNSEQFAQKTDKAHPRRAESQTEISYNKPHVSTKHLYNAKRGLTEYNSRTVHWRKLGMTPI